MSLVPCGSKYGCLGVKLPLYMFTNIVCISLDESMVLKLMRIIICQVSSLVRSLSKESYEDIYNPRMVFLVSFLWHFTCTYDRKLVY